MRFKVVEGSQSAHCCFEYTVVDTLRPVMIGGQPKCEALCECFNKADANAIAAALNKAEGA